MNLRLPFIFFFCLVREPITGDEHYKLPRTGIKKLASIKMNQACKTNIDISIGSFYCYGEGFVKVLMQDYGLLHGVIAFVTTHYNA